MEISIINKNLCIINYTAKSTQQNIINQLKNLIFDITIDLLYINSTHSSFESNVIFDVRLSGELFHVISKSNNQDFWRLIIHQPKMDLEVNCYKEESNNSSKDNKLINSKR